MTKKRKKVFLFILSVCFGLWAGSVTIYAQMILDDDAGLFTYQQKIDIQDRLRAIERLTNGDVMVVTTTDTKGKASQDFADDYYDEHHSKEIADMSGFLLLLDMKNRVLYLSTAGVMIQTMNDNRIANMLDSATPYMTTAYDQATLSALTTIESNYRSDQPGMSRLKWIIVSVIALMVGLFIYFWMNARYRLQIKQYRYPFRDKSSLELTIAQDVYLNSVTTTRVINRSSSSGSSGGSSTHRSSSGGSHGGGGRSF